MYSLVFPSISVNQPNPTILQGTKTSREPCQHLSVQRAVDQRRGFGPFDSSREGRRRALHVQATRTLPGLMDMDNNGRKKKYRTLKPKQAKHTTRLLQVQHTLSTIDSFPARLSVFCTSNPANYLLPPVPSPCSPWSTRAACSRQELSYEQQGTNVGVMHACCSIHFPRLMLLSFSASHLTRKNRTPSLSRSSFHISTRRTRT